MTTKPDPCDHCGKAFVEKADFWTVGDNIYCSEKCAEEGEKARGWDPPAPLDPWPPRVKQ